MKVLKMWPVQTHDFDSDDDEDYVTFMESGCWSSDIVWMMFQVFCSGPCIWVFFGFVKPI